ncbi:hypothetical protein HanRHA438_Chr10g0455701 [Helianthus annuus]|nr:hypothetical protein HanRHA438_Chr10g0455701 [Helianthus annuus]
MLLYHMYGESFKKNLNFHFSSKGFYLFILTSLIFFTFNFIFNFGPLFIFRKFFVLRFVQNFVSQHAATCVSFFDLSLWCGFSFLLVSGRSCSTGA